MKVTEVFSSSGHHAVLHMALNHALDEYERVHAEVARNPPLSEESASPELTFLHYEYEQWRVTALVLAAALVEAVGNYYLAFKAGDAKRFKELERESFMDKWTTVPKLFVPGYNMPMGGQPYQDLKRLGRRRNELVHLKESVSKRGVTVHKGSMGFGADEYRFVMRCRTLADRLLQHVAKFDKTGDVGHASIMLAFAPALIEGKKVLAALKERAGPDSVPKALKMTTDLPRVAR